MSTSRSFLVLNIFLVSIPRPMTWPIDFAIVSLAAVIAEAQGVCLDARLVLGAVASAPVRAKTAEEFLRGRTIDEEAAVQAAELALTGARPLSRNAYKVVIAKTLIKRAILGQGQG